MPFTGSISWHKQPDMDRPGFHVWVGYPAGYAGHFIVQDDGDATWSWVLMSDEGHAVQMRTNGANEDLTMASAVAWLTVNPNG